MLESYANISIYPYPIYIHMSGAGLREWTSMRTKHMERNNYESNMHFMIGVTVKGLL